MQLSNVDANLLYPLYVLLEEQHVERAARRLHLSPSATSHALARLRDALGDPLLVRSGRGLMRSARANELRPVLERVVLDMARVFGEPRSFEPSELERTFRMATVDALEAALFSPLFDALASEARGVTVTLTALTANSFDALRRAELDLLLHAVGTVSAGLESELLLKDRFVTVMRKGHPATVKRLSLKRFASLEHVLVSPTGETRGVVDRMLGEQGLSRRLAAVVPSFASALMLVARTDFVTTLPARFAAPLLAGLKLTVVDTPLDLAPPQVFLVWHQAANNDAAHRWFRELLVKSAKIQLG